MGISNSDLLIILMLFVALILLCILSIWVMCALITKRLHDIGKSGWLLFFGVLFFPFMIYVLALTVFKKGDEEPNAYDV